MGYISHEIIVVTSWDAALLKLALRKAEQLRMATSEIIDSGVNGIGTFIVAPDGSKEGWDEAIIGEARRKKFKAWLNLQRYEDHSSSLEWFEARYGNDDECVEVIASQWLVARCEGAKG